MLELWRHHVHIVASIAVLVLIATIAIARPTTVVLPCIAALIAITALLKTVAATGIVVGISIDRNVLAVLLWPRHWLSTVLHGWLTVLLRLTG